MTKIITNNCHGYIAGNIVYVLETETRWWVKVWFKATFREVPPRRTSHVVTPNVEPEYNVV